MAMSCLKQIGVAALIAACLCLEGLAAPQALVFTDYGLKPEILRPGAKGLERVGVPSGSQADDLQALPNGRLIYSIYTDVPNAWDWFELDPASFKSRPIAKSSWVKQGFMELLPYARSDGGFYARVHFAYASPVYTLHPSRGAKAFLAKTGIYDFAPLADGSYVYATWAGHGPESNDFVDMIQGRNMSLWHQPLKGAPSLLGSYGTIQELRPVQQGKAIVFAVPGRSTGAKSWKILHQVPGKAARMLAELPHAGLRSGPRLISWLRADWLVWAVPVAELESSASLYAFSRVKLSGGAPQAWRQGTDFAFERSASPDGCLAWPRVREDEGEHNYLDLYDSASGQLVQTIPYRWRDQAPSQVYCRLGEGSGE